MTNLNKDIKVFFIDLDGTLLDTTKDGKLWISDTNVNAIKKVQNEGKQVIISTGRLGPGVKDFMKRAGVEYAVTGNGSQIIDINGKVYKDDKLTLQQSLLIFNFVKKHNLAIKLDGQLESFGAYTWLQKRTSKKFGFFPNENFNMPMHKQYTKIVMWGKSKSKISKLGDLLRKEVPNLSVVSSAGGWTIEITNEKATKGIANDIVAREILKIEKKSEMAHLGDTLNDSTTAKYMRLIAMGNSTKKLKEMADYIGPKCKDAGVAKILSGQYKKVQK